MLPEYKRLPGRNLISLAWRRGSLWMGPDHLLMIIRSGYTQEYKRFYYKDIQGIHLRATSTGTVLGSVLGAITGICLLVLGLGWAFWHWEAIWLLLWGATTAFWILVLTYHLIRGRTCECLIQTAVQTESLVSLKRLRPSRKAFHILREKIEELQGILDPSLLEGKFFGSAVTANTEHSSLPIHEYQGGAHGLLFAVFMLSGFLALSNIFVPSQWIYISGYFIFAVLLILVVVSLIHQQSTSFPDGLKVVTGISFVYLVLFAFASYFLLIFYSVDNPAVSIDYWKMFRALSNEDPRASMPLLVLHIFSVASTWSLGMAGMFLLYRYRSQLSPGVPVQHSQKSL